MIESPVGDFRWVEAWAELPAPRASPGEGRTHGVAVLANGDVLVIRQSVPSVLRYSPRGDLIGSWGNFPGAHGLSLVDEDGEEFVWLTDEFDGRVEKYSVAGKRVLALAPPPLTIYAQTRYCPTWVAVDERRWGGSGRIWVADGYGANLVHRYDAEGNYIGSLDGSEGAGRFRCPHGLGFDRRRGREPALYIADRGNRRFQVFSADGTFVRAFGDAFLTSPDTFVPCGDFALVPELYGRLTVLDAADNPVAVIGAHDDLRIEPGWANKVAIQPGRFNSPHAAAVDRDGSIYVVEWRVGGRVVKLEKLP